MSRLVNSPDDSAQHNSTSVGFGFQSVTIFDRHHQRFQLRDSIRKIFNGLVAECLAETEIFEPLRKKAKAAMT